MPSYLFFYLCKLHSRLRIAYHSSNLKKKKTMKKMSTSLLVVGIGSRPFMHPPRRVSSSATIYVPVPASTQATQINWMWRRYLSITERHGIREKKKHSFANLAGTRPRRRHLPSLVLPSHAFLSSQRRCFFNGGREEGRLGWASVDFNTMIQRLT